MGLLLDDLGVAAYRAVSVRKLRSAYAGSCLRVKRSSDNTEQDIGFSGDELDTASLLAFCGAGSGVVVTWYDQSGNGRNWIGNSGSEPRIVNAGSLETKTFNSVSRPTLNAHTAGLGMVSTGAITMPATVMAVWSAADVTQDRSLYVAGSGGGGPWFYGTDGSKQRQPRYFVAAIGSSTTNLTNSALFCGGGRRTNGGAYNFWLNGATDGGGTATGSSTNSTEAYLFADPNNATEMVGTCSQFVEWASSLSDANALTANQHDNTSFGTAIPSGGTYTLTADAGAFTLTGQAASLLYNRLVAANAGSFALAGQAASLERGWTLTAEAGSFALAGQAASLLRTYLLSANAGSFALTGQDATLSLETPSRTLAADSGSFALTGSDAALTYTPVNHYSLSANAGSYALTGQAASLLWSGQGFWTPVSPTSETWTSVSPTPETWTPASPTSETWTPQ